MAATSQNKTLFEDYDGFVEKFKPKKTTDDCYTPPEVYDAVLSWVRREYDLGDAPIIRPFYPGGDYQAAEYPDGCVVVDNPPFSIYSKIVRWYLARGIRFFLFAPNMTCIVSNTVGQVCYIVTVSQITYANGAKVPTAFATNLEPQTAIRTAPDLRQAVAAARVSKGATVSKYIYPDTVVTSANFGRLADINFHIPSAEAAYVSNIDAQRQKKRSTYGAALLISERAAAERAAAERAAAYKLELSDREREIVKGLAVSN